MPPPDVPPVPDVPEEPAPDEAAAPPDEEDEPPAELEAPLAPVAAVVEVVEVEVEVVDVGVEDVPVDVEALAAPPVGTVSVGAPEVLAWPVPLLPQAARPTASATPEANAANESLRRGWRRTAGTLTCRAAPCAGRSEDSR